MLLLSVALRYFLRNKVVVSSVELFSKFWATLYYAGLKVNDQLVTYATRFLPVRLKYHVWSHHRAFKAKVQFDFSSADHTNVLRVININLN